MRPAPEVSAEEEKPDFLVEGEMPDLPFEIEPLDTADDDDVPF